MGRKRRIDVSARGTTISLTASQKSLIRKLQTKRLDQGETEPLLNEVVIEGLKALFEKEGFSGAELESAFPKTELRTAAIRIFPKRKPRR